MKVNLKDKIWIEGFDSITLGEQVVLNDGSIPKNPIYFGKTSEIPEETVKDYIVANKGAYLLIYKNYSTSHHNWFKTIQESILSACDKPYCIIYKTE